MPALARLLPLLLGAVLVRVPVVLCDSGPVTIDQSDVYKQQRVCARKCFVDFNDVGYPIAMEISCPTFRVQNDCFCRPYLQQQAHQFVYSCISDRCGASEDISVATKLYDDYCTSNGFTTAQNAPPQQTGSEGASTITITVPPTVVVTTTSTATVTVTASAGSRSERPLRGWVFGLAAFIATLMAREVGIFSTMEWGN